MSSRYFRSGAKYRPVVLARPGCFSLTAVIGYAALKDVCLVFARIPHGGPNARAFSPAAAAALKCCTKCFISYERQLCFHATHEVVVVCLAESEDVGTYRQQ